MKTIIKTSDLQSALSKVSGIARNGIIPVLSCVLVSKEANVMSFVTSDDVMQVGSSCECDGNEEFAFCVDFDRLNKVVSNLAGDTVSIDVQDNSIIVKSGRSKFNIQTLPTDSYPVMSVDGKMQVSVDQAALKAMLQSVVSSSGVKSVKHYLNGALFEVKDNVLSVVGSDSSRIAVNSMPLVCADIERIIPRATVSRLIKTMDKGDIEIEFSDNMIRFGDQLISKVIEAKYPDYRRLLQVEHKESVEINRQSLIDSCKRVAIPANDKFRGIAVSVGEEMKFSFVSQKENAEDSIDIAYVGELYETGLNADFLIDAASSFDAESVVLNFSHGINSVLMTGEGSLRHVLGTMKL